MKMGKVIWILLAPVLLYALGRVLVTDRFMVRGESMKPAFHDGEGVWVNKLVFGPRIYTGFDFSNPDLHAARLPGMRRIRAGDVALFNCPYGRDSVKIQFRINYVYLKRCVGAPGDTLSIADGFYVNRAFPGILGDSLSQARLAHIPDSLLPGLPIFPFSDQFGWTVRNAGPMVIPAKGRKITLNEKYAALYGQAIEYETGNKPLADGSVYVFQKDYYYFSGDNVVNSRDSRSFGFVPEDYIIGVVPQKKRRTDR
jgi:signal peptidase I